MLGLWRALPQMHYFAVRATNPKAALSQKSLAADDQANKLAPK
jgi:hypothetical protein